MKPEYLNNEDGELLIHIMRRKANDLNTKFNTTYFKPRDIDKVLWSIAKIKKVRVGPKTESKCIHYRRAAVTFLYRCEYPEKKERRDIDYGILCNCGTECEHLCRGYQS